MTIDDVLPTWDWRSAHNAKVAASPERAAAAAREISGRDLPVTGALMRIRMLGRHRSDDRPILEAMARIGLVMLIDEPRDVVLGGVISPWRLRGGHRRWAPPTSCAPSPSPAGRARRRPSPTPGRGLAGAHRDADRGHR